jgi:hypothetical protein
MERFTVKSKLLTVLNKQTIKSFTVDDLTEAYLKDPVSVHTSKKSARQFVYRNMLRLIKSGDLERLIVDQGWPLYALTKPFTGKIQTSKVTVHTDVIEAQDAKADPAQSLKDKLNLYKLDMLSAMGETEEYNAICSEIPELRDEVQPLYNASRDRFSKLLGRVKALESLLVTDTR